MDTFSVGTLVTIEGLDDEYIVCFIDHAKQQAVVIGPCFFEYGIFKYKSHKGGEIDVYQPRITDLGTSINNDIRLQREIQHYQGSLPQTVTRFSHTQNATVNSIHLFKIKINPNLDDDNMLNLFIDADSIVNVFDYPQIYVKIIFTADFLVNKISPRVDTILVATQIDEICKNRLDIDPKHVQIAHKKYKETTNDNQKVIIKYMLCGIVGYNDRIENGFFDVGRINNDHSYEFDIQHYMRKWYEKPTDREIIYVNRSYDIMLDKIYNSWKIALDLVYDLKTKAIALAQMVDIYFVSNKDKDDEFINASFMDEMRHVTSATKGLMDLGKITYGVCRHKSIMYKYICDRVGISCSLIRGNADDCGHTWNLVLIDGKQYLVDVRNNPDRLIEEHEFQLMDFFKEFRRLHKTEDVDPHLGMSILKT